MHRFAFLSRKAKTSSVRAHVHLEGTGSNLLLRFSFLPSLFCTKQRHIQQEKGERRQVSQPIHRCIINMHSFYSLFVLLVLVVCGVSSFTPAINHLPPTRHSSSLRQEETRLFQKKISDKRRKQLGIADDEDEYDLGFALDQNTDPLISKIIAGSLIVVLIGLLVAGVVIPSLTDYGEGVCSPIQNAGRC